MPSLARSVPKPLKVPSLARSVPTPLKCLVLHVLCPSLNKREKRREEKKEKKKVKEMVDYLLILSLYEIGAKVQI